MPKKDVHNYSERLSRSVQLVNLIECKKNLEEALALMDRHRIGRSDIAPRWLYVHTSKIIATPVQTLTMNFTLRGQYSIRFDRVEVQIEMNSNNLKKTSKH